MGPVVPSAAYADPAAASSPVASALAAPPARPVVAQEGPRSADLARALQSTALSAPKNSFWEAAGGLAQLWAGKRAEDKYLASEAEKADAAKTAEQEKLRGLAAALAGTTDPNERARMMIDAGVGVDTAFSQLLETPKPAEGFTLSEGQIRYDANGNPIAGAAKPGESFTLGEGQVRYDAEGNPVAGVPKAPDVAKPTDDISEYNFYSEQERAAGRQPMPFADYISTVKKAGASQTSIDLKSEGAEASERGKAKVQTFAKIAEDLPAADQALATINELGAILPQTETGTEAAVLEWVRRNTGLTLSDQADKTQAVSSLIDYLTPRMRVPGSGATSDYEMQTFKNALPSLMGTPEGNKLVIDTLTRLAQRRVEMAAIAQDYLAGTIEYEDAVTRMRALPDPLETFKASAGPKAAAPAADVPPAPAGIDPDLWNIMTPEERALWSTK